MSSRQPTSTIFIGNIPFEVNEEQLRDIFKEVGPVKSLRIMQDRETGKPKGFAFVEYFDLQVAESAVRNLSGYEINGRNLRVDFADDHQSSGHRDKKLRVDRDARDRDDGPPRGPPPHEGHRGGPPPGQHMPPGAREVGPAAAHAAAMHMVTMLGAPAMPGPGQDKINNTLAGMTRLQLYEIMKQMKMLIQVNLPQARGILVQNPQLTKALFQAQVLLGMVKNPVGVPGPGPMAGRPPPQGMGPPGPQQGGVFQEGLAAGPPGPGGMIAFAPVLGGVPMAGPQMMPGAQLMAIPAPMGPPGAMQMMAPPDGMAAGMAGPPAGFHGAAPPAGMVKLDPGMPVAGPPQPGGAPALLQATGQPQPAGVQLPQQMGPQIVLQQPGAPQNGLAGLPGQGPAPVPSQAMQQQQQQQQQPAVPQQMHAQLPDAQLHAQIQAQLQAQQGVQLQAGQPGAQVQLSQQAQAQAGQAAPGAAPQLAPEQKDIVRRLLQLSPEQVAALTPEQKQQVEAILQAVLSGQISI